MPREPGKAALRAWRQRPSALPDEIRAVLAAAELAAERTAARVRLCVLILIGLVLVGLGSKMGWKETVVNEQANKDGKPFLVDDARQRLIDEVDRLRARKEQKGE